MSRKFKLVFLVIVGAQVLLLLGLIADREYTLRAGVDVVLETLPIDPRSLLQGDYVVLRYEIAQIPEDWKAIPGREVYVYLEEGPEAWHVVRREFRQANSDDSPFVRGTVGPGREIDFGIETYFIPEGSGHIIERSNDIKVVVSVDIRGRAVIKDVLVDGEPFHDVRAKENSP